jgi:hypothetical protein
MLHQNKEYDDTEFALSDGERTPFRGRKRANPSSKHYRLVGVLSILAYLILGGLHINLRLQYAHLESKMLSLSPELFPCMPSFNVI